MQLYTFFRSSAAYRVRIALNLKGLSADMQAVRFANGENRGPAYRAVNPQMRVPSLVLDNSEILTQSLAIIEYLDEVHPQPPLLPIDPVDRARVRALAQIVACDIHPLNNLSSLNYLRDPLKHDEAAVNAWYHHWVRAGFEAMEMLVQPGPYSFGSTVTIADICLIPQLYNARRFKVPLEAFPKLVAIDSVCASLAAFERALPENQPDAV